MQQNNIITKEKLPRKYEHEIHTNEIVLLAYYIATININLSQYNNTTKRYW